MFAVHDALVCGIIRRILGGRAKFVGDRLPRESTAKAQRHCACAFLAWVGAPHHPRGGVRPQGREHPRGLAFKAAHPGRLLPLLEVFSAIWRLGGDRIRSTFFFRRMPITFAICFILCIGARSRGRASIRVWLDRIDRLDPMPLFDGWQAVVEVATRRGYIGDANPGVGIGHMVEARGAGWGTLC